MARVKFVEYEQAQGRVKEAFDQQIAKNGSVTNMKKALLNSIDVYDSYLTRVDVDQRLVPHLPEFEPETWRKKN